MHFTQETVLSSLIISKHREAYIFFLKKDRNCSVFSKKVETFCCCQMDDRKEKNSPWLSVPQFGDWDQKGQLPDYSMDFSKIREMRKQNKRDPSRASIGNEENLISLNTRDLNKPHDDDHQNHSPTGRGNIFSYFKCCVFKA